MKIKLLLNIAFCFILLQATSAQQLPNFGAYQDHWQMLNPAALANNYLTDSTNITIGATYRKQWIGFEEAPETKGLSFQYIPKSNRIITGFQIINDKTGLLSHTGVYGQFAYRIALSQKQEISIGLNAGVLQYNATLSQIEFRDEEEQPQADGGGFAKPDFSFGAFYHFSNQFYLGFSIPQIFALNSPIETDIGNFYIQRARHYYGLVGGFIPVNMFGVERSYIEPTVWFRYLPNAPLSMDVNLRYCAARVFWIGAGTSWGFGTSTSNSLRLELGFLLGEKNRNDHSLTKIGVNFEIPFSTYRKTFGNSIELNIIYSWKE